MYYLLENGRIINSNDYANTAFWITEQNHLLKHEAWQPKQDLGLIIKKSENILDLAETGDCIEIYGRIESIYSTTHNEDGSIYHIGTYSSILDTNKDRLKQITALLKKQPNGDYKLYEVGK